MGIRLRRRNRNMYLSEKKKIDIEINTEKACGIKNEEF